MRKNESGMAKSKKKKRDPLPEQFSSPEEAGEFWDTHSGADYEDYMKEVHFEVDLKRRVHEVRVAEEVLREVRKIADQQGLDTETLINLWLQQKVTANAKASS
jgi:predicted DNA binding CopG/RHH family protein